MTYRIYHAIILPMVITIGNKEVKKIKNKLIEEVLKLIEETEDVNKINMRQVAKRAGCAHTNIYNYFENMEEMLWYAIIPAMEQFNKATVGAVLKMDFDNDEDRIRTVFLKNIEYALAHRGLYHFIWLVKAPDTKLAPQNLEIMLKQLWYDFLDSLFTKESSLSIKDRNRIGNILFSYLQGEICRLIKSRYISDDVDKIIKHILDNGSMLFTLLKKDAAK